ncbi:MAG: isopeptide-forming domain-containing fimbrial protein [Coriobacteriales bacterium]|nr:isopeptide-forming domain-containing fimbrial protein [Coriobacteriales bacterium]
MNSICEGKRVPSMVLAVMALVVLALSALPALAFADDVEGGVLLSTPSELQLQAASESVSGTWGTCAWEIKGSVLTIHSGSGTDQTAVQVVGEDTSADPTYVSPWAQYKVTDVRAVAEDGKKIVAPANCAGLFSGWTYPDKLESMDLSGMDVSNTTDMTSIFEGCTDLETLNIGGWDASKLQKCDAAFKDCKKLKVVDIFGWTTSGDTKKGIFSGCEAVESIKVGKGFEMHVADDFPYNPAGDNTWYSTTDKKWYSRVEIKQGRQKVPDTYTNKEVAVGYYASESGVSWVRGSSDAAVFTFHHAQDDTKPYKDFDSLKVDSVEVDEKNYSTKSGSLIVSLEPSYLESLTTGDHTVTAVFSDGSASSTLTIKDTADTVYNVTVTSVSRSGASGTATATPTSGVTGSVVSLVAAPGAGSQLEKWEILSGSGASLSGNTLTIGSSDVAVQATFKPYSGDVSKWKAPEMENSEHGNIVSRDTEFTFTIKQQVPDDVTSMVIRFDLDPAMTFVSSQDDVVVSVDGNPINATKTIAGQLLTVSVDEATTATVHGKTVQVSVKAKVREDANLTSYLNAAKNTASIPYKATTTFQVNGVDMKPLSSNEEKIKIRYSSGSSTTKTTTTGTTTAKTTSSSNSAGLANTGDTTSLVSLATMALGGAGLVFAGRKTRR